MATPDLKLGAGGGPELNLLLPKDSLEQPLWKSLLQNLRDFFFPKKQPPLVLTSKPVPVGDIWGFYNYKKSGAWGSTMVHVLGIAAIIGGTILAKRMVVRNVNPKLPIEPTVVVPPQIKLAMNTLPNLGDPMSRLPSGPPSNGTGSGGGIGSGSGGGVGSGEGPGVGPGRGGGIGGGRFSVGGGVSSPVPIRKVDPEYSEEAR